MTKCLIDGVEFEGRKGKLYCSDKCRKKAQRLSGTQSVPDNQLSGTSVPDKSLNVPDVVPDKLNGTADKPAWQKVANGQESGVDIGFGKNDYTREMVEQRLAADPKDKFEPNWYRTEPHFKSKNHFKSVVWKNL